MYDKPVKLFSNVSAKDYDFPHEYYTPRDYYGYASQLAKKFCRKHPDADKDTVYMAASEAAEVYDLGGPNTRAKFQTVVEVKIRAALLELKKRRVAQNEPKEKEENELITPEIKAAIINDARAGMSAAKIAEKCGMSEKAVEYHLTQARKRGELPPAKGSTKKHKKPEPVIEEPRTVIANGERVTLPQDDSEPEPETVAENATTTQPEAYPGQINDDEPEIRPGDIIRGDVTMSGAPTLKISRPYIDVSGVWASFSSELAEHICNMLGAGSVCTERSYSEDGAKMKAVIRDAEGNKYKIRMEAV